VSHGHPHPQSPDVVARLARIEGHVRAIKQMAEGVSPCTDVLHQIGAVQAALRKVAQQVLEDHLDHCIRESVPDEQGKALVESLKGALSTYIR
jgi:DNA-binding FrmR family transcriptional regulator